MATQHQLSVLTNSSIKPPLNPKDGLPNTFHERVSNEVYWEDAEDEEDLEEERENEELNEKRVKHEYVLSPRDPKIEQLAVDLDTLSDQQFYERLQELKTDHQKTLQMCEKAYRDKVAEVTGSGTSDRVRDMSRPPIPPSHKMMHAWQKLDDSDADDSAAEERENRNLRGAVMERSSSLDRLSESMERVKNMWKDFNIEQYAPPRQSMRERPSSATGSHTSNKENTYSTPKKSADTWSPVITIPKPFKMTLRESNKQKKKTKAQEELEQKRLEEKKAEEAELSKKFKASPAPAHIYLPLYDELEEQQETKRRVNHNYREEILRSMEKPFKFYLREEAKKRQKLNQALYEGVKKEKKTNFKAKPVPKVLDEDVTEKMAEEEEYRKIRVRMRAEQLLRESRLPPSMDAREKTKELNRIKKLARELRGLGLSSEPSFRPKITKHVPDFDEQHRRLQKKLASSRAEKEPTVTQPFNLRTSRILSNKDRILEDIEQDEYRLPETRWPYKTERTKPSNIGKLSSTVTSADRIPSMTTQSTELRKSQTKKRITEEMKKELTRLEDERRRRQKEKRLKKLVVEKAAANDITYGLVDQTAEKLRRYREEERARNEEYRQSLKEMQDRVSERPLLFESAARKNARQRAERKYNETLTKAGVSVDKWGGSADVSPRQTRTHRDSDEDSTGSYRAPVRRTNYSPAAEDSPKSSQRRVNGTTSHNETFTREAGDNSYSYSNTFTKEETGLSDGDYTDEESIPEQVLETA